MRYMFLLLFLCLPAWAGQELFSQSNHDSLYKAISETQGNITAPMISGNGSWLTLRKRSLVPAWKNSDFDSDTVLIFNVRKPGDNKIATYRTAIRSLTFIGNNVLLLSDSLQTELFNLETKSSIYYKHVIKTEALNSKKQFLLHYSKQENNRLELRAYNGKLLNSLNQVYKYYTTKQGRIYALTETGNHDYRINLLNDGGTKQLYETSRKIEYLSIDPYEHGMIVLEQNSEDTTQEIVYLDTEDKTTYSFNEILSIDVQRGFTEVIQEGSIYFLKILTKKEKSVNTIADIWYGNDKRLEEKIYPLTERSTYYVWEPLKHSIRQIGNEHLTTSFNVNNDRYFLSFNPYQFQDYTKEQVPLLIYVYDMVKDHYFILDTIEPELRVSANGEYALSPKDRDWYLYHIPSGNKKLIPGKNLGKPWFTEDGKNVLFEGDEALWMYELQSGTLSEAAGFKGYQVSIINHEWEARAIPYGSFNKCTVNSQEPLIIKLYDPRENVTSFVLWYKGKSEVIIPSTTCYLQNLKSDEGNRHFIYTEENYNLPPRLVFKEIGRREHVLFQSDAENNAIFALKQEIISYTNSDGIPLKGILYYPLLFAHSQKYPMVVHIYEKQRHYSNLYPYPSYNEDIGFNIRLLLEKGYFVYMPDILIQGKEGFGLDALDCVNHALDAIAENHSIDKDKVGLTGHSFGGSETDFIATHSNRFAAYVSGSGASDILWKYHSFNYNFQWPDYIRIEANQYKMGVPFSCNKDMYFTNNPIYYAERVNAPILLWSGLEDLNVTSDHSMAFYNALCRNGKSVIALFYKNEGHGLQQEQAQFDLTSRILDWFDYYLKEDTGIEWIKKGIE